MMAGLSLGNTPCRLPEGMWCRYQGSKDTWTDTYVTGFNVTDGTYNLNVHSHAACERIAPKGEPEFSDEVWPENTLISYSWEAEEQ